MSDTEWSKTVDQLLYQIQQDDKHALQALFGHCSHKLLGLMIRVLHDQHEAEDVLQELFVKVWQQSHKYTGSGSAWGWLCVMARNSAIDRLRSRKNRSHESTDDAPELLQQLSESTDLSDRHWLNRCLQELNPNMKQAILLSYVNGYSHSELSEELSTPLGTVKAWIRRGLQELKQCLIR